MTSTRPDIYYGLCKFTFADGRRCAMPEHPDTKGFCRNHGTTHRRTQVREDDLFAELASPAGDFITKIDINHVLGKLFGALAANRISPRRAATLAYIGQLLLRSQEGARFEAANWSSEHRILNQLIDIKYPGQLAKATAERAESPAKQAHPTQPPPKPSHPKP
jgi:hypothetical protein